MEDPSSRPPDEDSASIPVEESRPRSPSSADNAEREAIELQEIQTREDDELDLSSASISSGEYRVENPQRSGPARPASIQTTPSDSKGPFKYVREFWTRHVVLTVPQKKNRDYFGEFCSRFWLISAPHPGISWVFCLWVRDEPRR